MDFKLKDKVAVVTGGADQLGLGFAIARTLMEEGCLCFIIDIDRIKLNQAINTLTSLGEVDGAIANVANMDGMESAVSQLIERFGRVDIWVNNAGVCPNLSLNDISLAEWDNTMAVNLRAIFISYKLAIPFMPRGGCMINAASFVSLIPTVGLSVYSASKAGVLSLTRVMAAELAAKGIRVNAYVPD